MDQVISAADAKRTFSKLLRKVREGQSYTVTAQGKPVAKIAPISSRQASSAKALFALLRRLRSERVTMIGRWNRDELYER